MAMITPMTMTMTIITVITMTEIAAGRKLLRLLTWMSPAFPIGAFAYSHGLERAVHDGFVVTRNDLYDWLHDLMTRGSAWNDALLFAQSWNDAQSGADLHELAALAEAMAPSAERHMETMMQGTAFLDAARAWPDDVFARLPKDCAMPVAAGALSGAHGIPLEQALAAYLHAFLANLIQAGLRLMPLGQADGVALLARLEDCVLATAQRACPATLDDLGSATILAEIASLKHETQNSRLFRS